MRDIAFAKGVPFIFLPSHAHCDYLERAHVERTPGWNSYSAMTKTVLSFGQFDDQTCEYPRSIDHRSKVWLASVHDPNWIQQPSNQRPHPMAAHTENNVPNLQRPRAERRRPRPSRSLSLSTTTFSASSGSNAPLTQPSFLHSTPSNVDDSQRSAFATHKGTAVEVPLAANPFPSTRGPEPTRFGTLNARSPPVSHTSVVSDAKAASQKGTRRHLAVLSNGIPSSLIEPPAIAPQGRRIPLLLPNPNKRQHRVQESSMPEAINVPHHAAQSSPATGSTVASAPQPQVVVSGIWNHEDELVAGPSYTPLWRREVAFSPSTDEWASKRGNFVRESTPFSRELQHLGITMRHSDLEEGQDELLDDEEEASDPSAEEVAVDDAEEQNDTDSDSDVSLPSSSGSDNHGYPAYPTNAFSNGWALSSMDAIRMSVKRTRDEMYEECMRDVYDLLLLDEQPPKRRRLF